MAKSRNTERKSNKNKVEYTFEVTRAYEFESGDVTFDMIVNGVSIYGCFIRENKKGEKFIAFPSHKGSDGKYYSYAYFPIDDDLIDDIIDAVDDKLDWRVPHIDTKDIIKPQFLSDVPKFLDVEYEDDDGVPF